MARNEPVTISMALGLSGSQLAAVGVVDATLNCDTNLFIDPLLLADASNSRFAECASSKYVARFEQLIALLRASKVEGDLPWKSALLKLEFHEISCTHLGYSAGTSGSGFGSVLSGNLARNAKLAIELGVDDPDLFVALSLFEAGVGPDRISDMTTNIIFECLVVFTQSVCVELGIVTREYRVGRRSYALPENPTSKNEPIVFVPSDVVRDLPVASDWRSVSRAARESEEVRESVSAQIGEIWKAKTKKDKDAVLDSALRSKSAFELLLELLRAAADAPYDVKNDHRGEIYPADLRRQIAAAEPLQLSQYSNRALSLDEAEAVVDKIIAKFADLVEKKGLWKELWNDRQTIPRLEKAMQRLFYAVAAAYCEANDLDLSPEADGGCGPVDFKMSRGAAIKVLAELKRSSNSKLVSGYTNQLEAYKGAENATRAFYVVIDIGGLTAQKTKALSEARSANLTQGKPASRIVYIDGSTQKSASKRS